MKVKIFIKSINDISKEEKKKIDLLIKNKKLSIHSKVAYYLLQNFINENNLNYNVNDIKYTLNGKPYLNDNLKISISNKNDIVVLVISNLDIGVDIEEIKTYDNKILKYFFTKEEQNKINNNIDFFKIYTLKESFIKMKDLKLLDISLDAYNNYYNKTIKYKNYIISYVINYKNKK